MNPPIDELCLLAGEYGFTVERRGGRYWLLDTDRDIRIPATTHPEGLEILRMALRREAQVQGFQPRGAA